MNDCGRRQTVREVEEKGDETRKVGEPSSELHFVRLFWWDGRKETRVSIESMEDGAI